MSSDYDVRPFPNVGNNVFYNKEFSIGNMLPTMGSTEGFDTTLANTDIMEVIKRTNDSIKNDGYIVESAVERNNSERNKKDMMELDNIVESMFNDFFGCDYMREESSGGDPDIPDLIEPIVHEIEAKGYKVKYSSPGYSNTRFDNDRNKDGVINAKMATTGRIIFSRNYTFKTTPKGWEWKILQNGAKALYVKPYTYNEKMGSKKEAFLKWRRFYLESLKHWAVKLPQCGTSDYVDNEPDENFN